MGIAKHVEYEIPFVLNGIFVENRTHHGHGFGKLVNGRLANFGLDYPRHQRRDYATIKAIWMPSATIFAICVTLSVNSLICWIPFSSV